MNKTLAALLIALTFWQAGATETEVIVRAKAKDAKFIGDSIGGAYVIIRDTANRNILAEGKTSGSTGNTDLIMNAPIQRGRAIADDSTAHYRASVDINEPVFVDIEVLSPFNHRQAQVRASTQIWLIPGRHILGEGIVLEIPGFIIDVLEPRTHRYLDLASLADKPLRLQANIVMMCGCTIDKGGVWDSEQIIVRGVLKRNGQPFSDVEMTLVETNLFEGDAAIRTAGNYELTISAYNPTSGNTGVDKVNFVVYD
jgi:hypothetical protein